MGTLAPNEPDPLPAFRRFAYLWLLLMALRVAGLPLLPDLMPLGRLAPLLDLAHAALLAGYLAAPQLCRTLGAAYLPVALIFAAFGAQTTLLLSVRLDLSAALAEPRSFTSIVGIAHWLLLWPTVAVVIGWKYTLRQVVQFALAMWLFNLVAVALLFRPVREPSLGGLIAVSFLSVALLTVGAFVRQLSQVEQRQREALAAANAQLVQAAATLEQLTVSRERNAMARELHDTLAHTLSSLAVQLETARAYWQADPAVARQQVEQALGATRTGLTETRRALQSLRASPLDGLGLTLAIEQLARSAAQRAGLTLELSLPGEPIVLAPAVEQGLYRIAQEALENVVRHARARTLRVSLGFDSAVTLSIADDGAGFAGAESPQPGHYGLVGMRERAELLGGRLVVASRPEHGTTVTATFGGEKN